MKAGRRFLDRACADDAELRGEVEALLACETAAGEFIETPALAIAAELLSRAPGADLVGRQLGPYAVAARLGSGAMGDVYRARDTRLHRDVALKVMSQDVVHDRDHVARFDREAQILASLNHPNIAAIYGVEHADGVQALVLELVDGPTLADRLAHGPIPIDDALPIARQIAEALEAAHEHGIIHRDLKPANIKVRPDGTVKVLDFGLAKLTQPSGETLSGQAVYGDSPALTTGVGVILGTAAYMSPEQARGHDADRRSDIWAFGAVLYEMLTGRRAFDGDDMADVLGAVVHLEPNWEALPSDVPPLVRTLLQACLSKDRRERVADISTALFVLNKSASLGVPLARTRCRDRGPRGCGWPYPWPSRPPWLGAPRSGLARRAGDSVTPRVSRLQITPTGPAALTVSGTDLAITPDGSRIVYVGNRGTQLFVRALDALEPVAVFTGAPTAPFVSPDGQWIAFVDQAQLLKRVKVTGGPPVTMATLDSVVRGATWISDDTIIASTNNGATGLLRVSTTGGPTTVLTRPDRSQGEADHRWPESLPGGQAVLFTITSLTGGIDAAQVAVLDLQTGYAHRALSRRQSCPLCAEQVELVVPNAETAIWCMRPAMRCGRCPSTWPASSGAVRPCQSSPRCSPRSSARRMPSSLVTARWHTYPEVGSPLVEAPSTLVWVDRQGRETSIPAPPRGYVHPRLSPDGTRIAVFVADQQFDIWVWSLAPGSTTLSRRTFDPNADTTPVWTADGKRIVFTSEQGGVRNLFWQADDGGGVERLIESPNRQAATGVAPDGRAIFTETAPATREDVMAVTLDRTRSVTPLVQSPSRERNGVVSPDGRWLAYESDSSGQFEIWVRPYPAVGTAQWQVTTGGGTRPLWMPRGQELLYIAPGGEVMGVAVPSGSSWGSTTPKLLVKDGYITNPLDPIRTYDVSADGQRFLLIKPDTSSPVRPCFGWPDRRAELGRGARAAGALEVKVYRRLHAASRTARG